MRDRASPRLSEAAIGPRQDVLAGKGRRETVRGPSRHIVGEGMPATSAGRDRDRRYGAAAQRVAPLGRDKGERKETAEQMTSDDWELIRATPLFGAMSRDAAFSLVGDEAPQHFEKGATLFRQGESATSFFVLLDGWVKLFRITPDGDEVVVGVFRRGETFAEAAMFLGGHYPVTAEAVTDGRLLRVNGKTLRHRIREQPDFALSMLASASHHLKALIEQIEQIKVMTAPQRVADFLLRLCPCKQGECTVELPYEKALIASRLGMKPGSLSRALAALRSQGVGVDRDHVSIADVERLAKYAASGDGDDDSEAV